MPEAIKLHNFASTPFSYKAGETFYVGLTFNYDVTLVQFEMIIYNAAGTAVLTFPNADWTLSGTRKKSITKTPVQVAALTAGTYRLVLKHTYQDGTVRVRFDSPLNVI
jgi:hypothetical protein